MQISLWTLRMQRKGEVSTSSFRSFTRLDRFFCCLVFLSVFLGLPSLALASDATYEWTSILTGSNLGDYIRVTSTATDIFENVYVTGYFLESIDFDPGIGTDIRTSPDGYSSLFLSKFNADGNLQWTKTLEDRSGTFAAFVSADSFGNVYIGGEFSSDQVVDFDPGPGVDNHTSTSSDFFLSKYDSSGAYEWTKTIDGTGAIYGVSVAFDASHNIYVIGGMSGSADFDTGVGGEERTAFAVTDLVGRYFLLVPPGEYRVTVRGSSLDRTPFERTETIHLLKGMLRMDWKV